jgi:hypothetical protein
VFDLTSAQYRFRSAWAEGDLYQALGLARGASSLDVDVAGARLAEQLPWMAQEVSKVVNVLTHRQRRTVYDAVRQLCDEVMATFAARHGPEFGNSFSDYRHDIWQRCCRLFRFDPSHCDQVLGSKGAESLAQAGQAWIIREFLEARVTEVQFTYRDLNASLAYCEMWHTRCECGQCATVFYPLRSPAAPRGEGEGELPPQDFKAERYESSEVLCTRCRKRLSLTPLQFEDRFTFSFSAGVGRGDVVRGEPVYGGSAAFVVVMEVTGSPAPKSLLDRFFQLQVQGQDVTLDEVKGLVEKRLVAEPQSIVSVNKSPSPRGAGPSRESISSLRRKLSDLSDFVWDVVKIVLLGLVAGGAIAVFVANCDPRRPQPTVWPQRPTQPSVPQGTPPHIDWSPFVSLDYQDTALKRWLRRGGSKNSVPTEVVRQELERQKREERR